MEESNYVIASHNYLKNNPRNSIPNSYFLNKTQTQFRPSSKISLSELVNSQIYLSKSAKRRRSNPPQKKQLQIRPQSHKVRNQNLNFQGQSSLANNISLTSNSNKRIQLSATAYASNSTNPANFQSLASPKGTNIENDNVFLTDPHLIKQKPKLNQEIAIPIRQQEIDSTFLEIPSQRIIKSEQGSRPKMIPHLPNASNKSFKRKHVGRKVKELTPQQQKNNFLLKLNQSANDYKMKSIIQNVKKTSYQYNNAIESKISQKYRGNLRLTASVKVNLYDFRVLS